MKKITKMSAPPPHPAPRGTNGADGAAPRPHHPFRGGAVGHGARQGTRNILQVAKNNTYGENRHGAILSDHDVELMREMHEEYPRGRPNHLGYRKLAAIFGVSRSCAALICRYKKRIGHL